MLFYCCRVDVMFHCWCLSCCLVSRRPFVLSCLCAVVVCVVVLMCYSFVVLLRCRCVVLVFCLFCLRVVLLYVL